VQKINKNAARRISNLLWTYAFAHKRFRGASCAIIIKAKCLRESFWTSLYMNLAEINQIISSNRLAHARRASCLHGSNDTTVWNALPVAGKLSIRSFITLPAAAAFVSKFETGDGVRWLRYHWSIHPCKQTRPHTFPRRWVDYHWPSEYRTEEPCDTTSNRTRQYHHKYCSL